MPDIETIHATCVALDGKGVLITGASGRGKSALGLMLMGLGCDLVADDRVELQNDQGRLVAHCPQSIHGLIEARGIGVLSAGTVSHADIRLMVDLNETEGERIPERRFVNLLQCRIPLIYTLNAPSFPSAILQLLKIGWSDR